MTDLRNLDVAKVDHLETGGEGLIEEDVVEVNIAVAEGERIGEDLLRMGWGWRRGSGEGREGKDGRGWRVLGKGRGRRSKEEKGGRGMEMSRRTSL